MSRWIRHEAPQRLLCSLRYGGVRGRANGRHTGLGDAEGDPDAGLSEVYDV
jgi:hypothetical protein